jgi:broad specificity phosphatase PhoE
MRLRHAVAALLILGCASAPAPAPLAAPTAVRQQLETTVFIVRHAEKAPEPADDPVLSDIGQRRAADLAAILTDAGVDAILVSELQRTSLTAQPLARQLGITPVVVPVRTGADGQAKAIAEAIRTTYAGKTVLVVGHSNTVPVIARALGVTREFTIPDPEYDNLVVVRLRDGRATWVRARFGA